MKAKVPEGIRLTIGMIVKNEHKHLRNCLEAMKELRERVNCELIIADTGSEDDSLEVAREYADTVLEYQWDGDFSAARNATYDISRGEWYLFLDADEYLSDIEDLVEFLNGKERKNYFTGTICLRNRMNQDGSVYNEFRAARLFRYDKSRRFINRVHETIPVVAPVKNLEAIVIHHGYYYEKPEDWQKKQKRNMDLMLKELEETPEDARLLAHIADSANLDDRFSYLEKALGLVRDNKRHAYYSGIYRRMAAYYMQKGMLEEAAEILEEFFQEKLTGDDVVDLDIRALQARALHKLKRYDDAEEAFAAYFDLCDKYERHKLSLDGAMFGTVENVRPVLHNEMWELRSYCSQLRENLPEAMEWMCRIDYSLMNTQVVDGHFKRVLLLARDSKEFSKLAKFYARIQEQPDPQKTTIYIENQEKFCADLPEYALDVAQSYDRIELEDDFCCFMRLIAAQEDTEEYKQRLDGYIEKTSHWEKGYTDTLFLALKYCRSLEPVTNQMNSEQIEKLVERLVGLHKQEIVTLLLAYPTEQFAATVKGRFFLSALAVHAVSTINDTNKATVKIKTTTDSGEILETERAVKASVPNEIPRQEQILMFQLCIRSISSYVTHLYNSDMFNESDIGALPPIHRFGYYAGIADTCLHNGDELGYLRNMRRALKEDNQMKPLVTLLLEDFQLKKQADQNDISEFEQYAKLVKNKIKTILKSGKMEEARKLAIQYLKIKPNDIEIEDMLNSTLFCADSQSYIIS